MKKMRKALLALLLSITVAGTSAVPVMAAGTNTSVPTVPAQEADSSKADKLFTAVKGDYVQLFKDVLFDVRYDKYWNDDAAAVVGAGAAKEAVKTLKASVGSSTYGDKADPNAFYCGFINDVKEVSFQDGGKVEFTTTDSKKVSHTYKFLKKDALSGVMEGYVFQSTDKNEDEFKYVFLCPDTPATTYHIEFRYGSDLTELLKLNTGKYANWVGSGMLKSALTEKNEAMIQNCIALFCTENLAGMKTTETAAQQSALAGVWDADLNAYANNAQYKNSKMYCELKADGTGVTYFDQNGTGNYAENAFTFFAYDNDGNEATNSGVYISTGSDEITTAGKYTIAKKGDSTILTFDTLDGQSISYIKRDTKVAVVSEKTTLYVKGKTNVLANVVSGSGITTYTSSNAKVAKVDATGKVTALKKGTAVITATNNGVSGQVKITVKNPTLNKKTVTLKKGKTAKLTVKGSIGKVTYKSSNTKIATVSSKGVIKAKKAGKVTITVKSNGIALKCKVTVKK